MPLETGTRIGDLNPLWPLGTDPKSQGDDHIRLVKNVLVETLGDLADETIVEWLAPQLAEKLDLAGGTMTGALTLRGDDDTTPFADDEAIPKRYVDAFQIGVEEFHDPAGLASWRIIGAGLECFGYATTATAGRIVVTFPKEFAAAPAVTYAPVFRSGVGFTGLWEMPTPTQCELVARDGFGGGITGVELAYHAIGELAPDPPPP